MKNRFIKSSLLIIIICATHLAFAQVKFERIFGGTGYDNGSSVIQTYDTGYVVAGSTSSFGYGNTDMYIIKTNQNGIAKWQKTFGGINIDQAYSVSQTSDSGLVIAGYTNSFGHGGYDMYLIRTDKYGDTLWTKTYGGTDWDFAYSAQQTSDGGFILAGGTYSYGYGSQDVYLVKTNSSGDTLWTKTFGGIKDDGASCVKQTLDGGYIITGFTESFGEVHGDYYTIKTDNFGDTLWTKKLGFAGEDRASEIVPTSDGGYITSGVSENTAGGYNVSFLVKTNSLGDTLFTRKNGYPNDASSNTVCEANDGGYVWAGKLKIGTSYEVYLFKYNASGSYAFSFTLGSTKNEEATSIKQTNDHGYIVAANSNSFNNYLGDIYLFKTDSMGVSSGTISNYATGITQHSNNINTFTIYPNPTNNGKCIIGFSNELIKQNEDIKLNVYNSLGQVISSEIYKIKSSSVRNEIELNTSSMKSGLYFIEIIFDSNKITSKLIIENN